MRVIGAAKSSLRTETWILRLSCGHQVAVLSKRKPTRRIEPCQLCLADRSGPDQT